MRLAIVVVAATLFAWPAVASAADVNVNLTADVDDGQCQPAPAGNCSLREAVKYSAAGDTVIVPPGDYSLPGGNLAVDRNLTIQGAGVSDVTIHGPDNDRVFVIDDTVEAEIDGLTIADGDAGDGDGGGAWVSSGGVLRLTDAAVVASHAWRGAGVYNQGTLVVTRSTVAGNSADLDGGGIYNTSTGTLGIEASTVSGNTAVNDGGGVYILGAGNSFVNSTFSGNFADNTGGAMWAAASLALVNVTVADNQATSGGGIEFHPDTQLVNGVNSIFVRNGGGACAGIPAQIHLTYALTDDSECDAGNDPSNHLVVDSKLDFLADNGGSTRTQMPLIGSEAIDNGLITACPDDDQRGEPRPAGAGCDIGAVEAVPPATLTLITHVTNDDGGVWEPGDFTSRVGGIAQPADGAGVTFAVAPGTYTVSNAPARGYITSSITGACLEDGSVTLASGDDETCTITMDDLDVADNGVVLESYGPTRTDGDWGMTESSLAQTRGYLQDLSAFGPSGTVHQRYDVAPGIRVANERTLAGVDVFFTGWVTSSSYTPAEKTALRHFVEQGGTLIATTDDVNHTMVDAFGLTQADGAGNPTENVITAPDHAIANGAFGAVSSYRQYQLTGHYASLGPNAHEIGRYASGPGTTLAVIERGALAAGSGAAIFVADVDVFSDFGGSESNATLIKNIFAFAAGEGARPSISVGDVRAAEGSGTTPFTFTVRLSAASPSPVSVHYATADRTATAPGDYSATSGDLVFSPGQTSKQVTVAVRGDAVAEPDEQFLLNLSAAAGGRLADAQAVGTIVNDDQAQPSPPQPTLHKTAVAEPAAGTVTVKVPGSNTYVKLTAGQTIPLGTIVDTRKGRVTIVAAADGSGGTAQAEFYAGLFKVGQTKGKKPITELTLVEKLTGCKASGKASVARKKVKKRRLWGDGKGNFRTKGKHSAATVIGTKWLVEDRCTSTLTRVARGIVSVRDFGKKKTVKVKAPKKYVARAR